MCTQPLVLDRAIQIAEICQPHFPVVNKAQANDTEELVHTEVDHYLVVLDHFIYRNCGYCSYDMYVYICSTSQCFAYLTIWCAEFKYSSVILGKDVWSYTVQDTISVT